MEGPPRYHGSLVAFEGRSELVLTQLRLLPTSRQVLILPGIQDYLSKEDVEQPFDARQFIRHVHFAAAARHEAALEFLQQSTPQDKRLVFMDGGTARAQALCLSAICESETGADLARADAIFNGLVSEGVTGLAKDNSTWRDSIQTEYHFAATNGDEQGLVHDPITQAMRAADALDLETEELDPPSRDLDLTVNNRLTRSLSLPHLDFNNRFLGTNPFMAFREPSDTSGTPSTTTTTTPVKGSGMSASLRKRPTRISVAASACRSHIGEVYDMSAYPIFSPLTDVFTSPPTTPDKIEIGEARIIQIEDSPPSKPIGRARSMDRIFLGSEHISPSLLGFDLSRKPSPTCADKRSRLKQRPVSCFGTSSFGRNPRSNATYLEVPKAIFVKASKTTITCSPAGSQSRTTGRTTYVDKGVDAPIFVDDGGSESRNPEEPPFEPVLPLVEDLIIQFADESPNELFNFVAHGLKERSFPVIAESGSSTLEDPAVMPATPTSQRSRPTSEKNRLSLGAVRYSDAAILDADEYDPFASHGSCGVSAWTRNETAQAIETASLAARPSAPASSKPKPGKNRRFCTLSTTDAQTAVGLQNALRSVLDDCLPAEDDGYRASDFSALPETGSLWRPIFRQSESRSPGRPRQKKEQGIDLILAIGAQQGVKREYSSAITGQLEKLGTKPSGLSRSGRLELRYLITLAMQQFMAQPTARRTADSVLADHTLLATLVIQHLELFLAAHADVRFLLLEYPPEHVTTVLALQKLIGSDIIKVAGILDGEDSEPLAPAHLRHRGSPGKSSDRAARGSGGLEPSWTMSSAALAQSSPRNTWQSFSRANFLLTSSATDSEIATFISTIWKVLISISSYYIPEHAPRKSAPQAALPNQGTARVQDALSAIENTYSFPQENRLPSCGPPAKRPPASSSAPVLPLPAMPPMPPLPYRPPSPIESVRSRVSMSMSIRSGKSGRSGKTWRTGASTKHGRLLSLRSRRSRHGRGDTESVFGWIDTDEDDEDYDQEVKRVMPMFLRQRKVQTQKSNSRKALKWLGLA